MDMSARATLIEALTARGFKPGKPQNYGWTFQHSDGFKIEFNASGQFRLHLSDGKQNNGVMEKPEDALRLIDEAAEAL